MENIMDEKFLKNIKEDLEKSGFGSELKALRIFENHGFHVLSGASFFDRDEEKVREIDISANMSKVIKFEDTKYDYYIFNRLYLCAEVKKSEKPWVVFKSNHEDNEYHKFIDGLRFMKTNNSNKIGLYREIDEFLYDINVNWGFKGNGIHEAFKSPNNPSRWYGACMSSLKEYWIYMINLLK